jgi:class 3 adenylate cyclase
MAEQNTDVPQDKRIEFRIGIHVGDIKYGPVEGLWRSLMYGSWQPQT